MSLSLWPKFLLEVALSLACTVLLYEVAVRRYAAARFLFGMKPLEGKDAARVPLGRMA